MNPATAALSVAQQEFVDNHAIDRVEPGMGQDDALFMYRVDAAFTDRWLVLRTGFVVEHDRFERYARVTQEFGGRRGASRGRRPAPP